MRTAGPEPRSEDRPPQRSRAVGAARGGDGRPALSRYGEALAAAHLTRLGFSVLAGNVRTRAGEIDLIGSDGRTLVFAEIKTRRVRAPARGIRPDQEPLTGLRPRQRARLRRLALAWLADRSRPRPRAQTIRFDAIGVIVDCQDGLVRLDHVEGAF
jgi:putative endonuclease